MTGFLRAFWAFLTRWTWGLPSLLTEALGGLAADALALPLAVAIRQIGAPTSLRVLVLATALSLGYEWKLDPNGWSLRDVAEREAGIGLGVGVGLLWEVGMVGYVIVAALGFVGGLLVGRKLWVGRFVGRIGDEAEKAFAAAKAPAKKL